jgi:GT2 family glycosyltransferase
LQLSVIIVNYNVKFLLEKCLISLQSACRNISAEIFVVDNASSDGSRAYFDGKFTDVQFSWNRSNMGFGKANNSVLHRAKGEYVLFLNPDTVVPEDCLEKCLSFFSQHSDCGALGVRMIDGKGVFLKESKRGFPGISASFFKMFGLQRLFPRSRFFARYYLGHLPENETHTVDVLAGAFMMLSRAVLQRVKGFDEDFFMYGEDIDLSCRIVRSGFKNYFYPEAYIVHHKGESTQKKSREYVNHFYGAMQIFVRKYYSKHLIKKSFLLAAIGFQKRMALCIRMF